LNTTKLSGTSRPDEWLSKMSPSRFGAYFTSIDGMIQATEANLATITNDTIVIPGHGSVGDKSQLTFYRDMLASTREKVATLKKQGRFP
jgi:hypothetical protein